jgi:hypothetical protein
MSQTHTDGSHIDSRAAADLSIETTSPSSKRRTRHSGGSTPVLDPALLARVQQLNLDYLELLVAEYTAQECAAQLQHLPPRQRSALVALPARALRLIAGTSYSLYSLGFEDESFWESVCANSAEAPSSVVHRYARVGDASAQYAFCKVALLHAWHVAATNPLAARVVYAMPQVTAQRLAAAPLWQIRCIASSHATLLMPRWPTNPAFWPDLIRFAAANDMKRLPTARLLGTQLIAAELELACAMSRRDPRIAPIASPRLRARKLQMEPRSR